MEFVCRLYCDWCNYMDWLWKETEILCFKKVLVLFIFNVKYEKQNLEFKKLKWFKCDFRTPHVCIVEKINSLVGVEKPILTLVFLVLLFHKC